MIALYAEKGNPSNAHSFVGHRRTSVFLERRENGRIPHQYSDSGAYIFNAHGPRPHGDSSDAQCPSHGNLKPIHIRWKIVDRDRLALRHGRLRPLCVHRNL